jgi:hypothetical protein
MINVTVGTNYYKLAPIIESIIISEFDIMDLTEITDLIGIENLENNVYVITTNNITNNVETNDIDKNGVDKNGVDKNDVDKNDVDSDSGSDTEFGQNTSRKQFSEEQWKKFGLLLSRTR